MSQPDLADNCKRLLIVCERLSRHILASDPALQFMFDELYTKDTQPKIEFVLAFHDSVYLKKLAENDPQAACFVSHLAQAMQDESAAWAEVIRLLRAILADAPSMQHNIIVKAIPRQMALVPAVGRVREVRFELSDPDRQFLRSLKIATEDPDDPPAS